MSDIDSQIDSNDALEDTFEVPEKYKGKNVNDVIKMHMEAEKERSRLGNEVGTLRSMADQLLGLQREKTQTPREPRKPITVDELLANPEESLEKAIQENPEVTATKQELQRMRLEVAQSKFERDFPSYQEDIADPAFGEWIKANKARNALGISANSGDYEAASALWSMWEERKQDLAEIKTKKKELTKKAEKLGTLEGSGVTGLETEKIYSRVDLMELNRKALAGDPEAKAKWNDPTFQAERLKAYAEKRVR